MALQQELGKQFVLFVCSDAFFEAYIIKIGTLYILALGWNDDGRVLKITRLLLGRQTVDFLMDRMNE